MVSRLSSPVLNKLSTTPWRRSGSWCIYPSFLDLGTSWSWEVSYIPWSLQHRITSPRYPLDMKLRCPARSQSLYRIRYPQQGKPKYSEKTCPSATLSTTNPTWLDPGLNPARGGGKPETNRLSYGVALYSSLLVPNVPLSTLFSDSTPLCSFLNMTDQVAHSYKIPDSLFYLCFKFMLLYFKRLSTRLSTEKCQAISVFSLVSVSIWT
jgi:hypothetical protein